jgi:spore germination cell wall hydrolase CwlJ-like protein
MKSTNARLRTLFAASIITLIAASQIKADTAMASPAVSSQLQFEPVQAKSKFEISVEEVISQPIPESEKIVNYDMPAEKEPDDSYDATHRTQKQINCIASAMHYEASGEPVEGQIAVAEVILNRVKSQRFKGTPCMVVAQKSQFSFVRRGHIPEVPEKRRRAMQHLASKVVNGEVQSKVKGSLFFHATRVKPKWKLKKNGKIGNHVFYK